MWNTGNVIAVTTDKTDFSCDVCRKPIFCIFRHEPLCMEHFEMKKLGPQKTLESMFAKP